MRKTHKKKIICHAMDEEVNESEYKFARVGKSYMAFGVQKSWNSIIRML